VSRNGTICIFNGNNRNKLEFNEETESAKVIGDLPFLEGNSAVYTTTDIANSDNNSVWLFAGEFSRVTNPILLFNLTDKAVYIPSGDFTSIPLLYEKPASVWDGQYGYLIGGFGRFPESDGSLHPRNGILK
jgi:hypothetical protein